MNDLVKQEFNRIKQNVEDTKKAIYTSKVKPSISMDIIDDMGTLIDIIDVMDKEIYKNVDVILYVGDDEEKIVYGDIDIQIDKNFIKTIAHRKDKDFITIYSVKYIHHLKIRPKGKIEELFESEVK